MSRGVTALLTANGGETMGDDKESYELKYSAISDDITVTVEKPISLSEGHAIELALQILQRRYYLIYGKSYRG